MGRPWHAHRFVLVAANCPCSREGAAAGRRGCAHCDARTRPAGAAPGLPGLGNRPLLLGVRADSQDCAMRTSRFMCPIPGAESRSMCMSLYWQPSCSLPALGAAGMHTGARAEAGQVCKQLGRLCSWGWLRGVPRSGCLTDGDELAVRARLLGAAKHHGLVRGDTHHHVLHGAAGKRTGLAPVPVAGGCMLGLLRSRPGEAARRAVCSARCRSCVSC